MEYIYVLGLENNKYYVGTCMYGRLIYLADGSEPTETELLVEIRHLLNLAEFRKIATSFEIKLFEECILKNRVLTIAYQVVYKYQLYLNKK